MADTERIARYTVHMWIDVPIDTDDSAADYTSPASRIAMEKRIAQLMRRAEGDTDCEVMEVEVLTSQTAR